MTRPETAAQQPTSPSSIAPSARPLGSALAGFEGLSLGRVRYPHRIEELLALRRAAYGAADKAGPDTATKALDDPRNVRAETVTVELGDRIIGSERLTPWLPGPILHHSCTLSDTTPGLPPRDQTLEASWACVHPDFMGRRIGWFVAAHALCIGRLGGARYLLGAADDQMWPFWRRCGFYRIDASYTGAISGNTYRVVVCDMDSALAGDGVGSVFWDILEPLWAWANTA